MKKITAVAILVGFIVSGSAVGGIQTLLPSLYSGPDLSTVQEWSFDSGTTGQTIFSADPVREDISFYGFGDSDATLSIKQGFSWESTGKLNASVTGSRIEVNIPNTLLAGKEFVDVLVMVAMSGYSWSLPDGISTSITGTSAERSSDTIYNILGINDNEAVGYLYMQTWRLTSSPDSFTYVLELNQNLDPTFGIDEIGIYTDAVLAPEPATLCLLGLGGLFLRRKIS